MAVVESYSKNFMAEVVQAEHDLTTATVKIALMDTAFAFDPATHGTWADCSGSEIVAGNGYTSGGETLANISVDTSESDIVLDADNVTWTASGGDIPAAGAAVIYSDTHASKTVIKCIDFGADYVTGDGKLFQINFSNGFISLGNE